MATGMTRPMSRAEVLRKELHDRQRETALAYDRYAALDGSDGRREAFFEHYEKACDAENAAREKLIAWTMRP